MNTKESKGRCKGIIARLVTEINETNKLQVISYYSRKVDKEFVLACVIYATSEKYADTNFSQFITQAIKHYIAEGLMKFEIENFQKAMREAEELLRVETPKEVDLLIDIIYKGI